MATVNTVDGSDDSPPLAFSPTVGHCLPAIRKRCSMVCRGLRGGLSGSRSRFDIQAWEASFNAVNIDGYRHFMSGIVSCHHGSFFLCDGSVELATGATLDVWGNPICSDAEGRVPLSDGTVLLPYGVVQVDSTHFQLLNGTSISCSPPENTSMEAALNYYIRRLKVLRCQFHDGVLFQQQLAQLNQQMEQIHRLQIATPGVLQSSSDDLKKQQDVGHSCNFESQPVNCTNHGYIPTPEGPPVGEAVKASTVVEGQPTDPLKKDLLPLVSIIPLGGSPSQALEQQCSLRSPVNHIPESPVSVASNDTGDVHRCFARDLTQCPSTEGRSSHTSDIAVDNLPSLHDLELLCLPSDLIWDAVGEQATALEESPPRSPPPCSATSPLHLKVQEALECEKPLHCSDVLSTSSDDGEDIGGSSSPTAAPPRPAIPRYGPFLATALVGFLLGAKTQKLINTALDGQHCVMQTCPFPTGWPEGLPPPQVTIGKQITADIATSSPSASSASASSSDNVPDVPWTSAVAHLSAGFGRAAAVAGTAAAATSVLAALVARWQQAAAAEDLRLEEDEDDGT